MYNELDENALWGKKRTTITINRSHFLLPFDFNRKHCSSLVTNSTYFQIPVHDSVMVAVVNAFQDLLNTMRGVGFAVEFPGDNVFEEFSAGDSVSVLRFQFHFVNSCRELV